MITGKYNPIYFLSDYDPVYPVIITRIKKDIMIMKDFVHAIRQIYRDCKTAINKVNVNGITHLSKEKQKSITDLKKRLLRKQVYKILYRLKKGFKRKYAAVGSIYIEGALGDLKELSIQFPSLSAFYKKTEKFTKKYMEIWAMQMEKSSTEGIPTSSNIIESKNSIFKTFIKKAKCFSTSNNMECFFATVALLENFDIKTRGKNKGTSAITRAEINLQEFGANDFFQAVGIMDVVPNPSDIFESANNYNEDFRNAA